MPFEKWTKNTLNMENFIIIEKAFNAFSDFPPYPQEPFSDGYERQSYNRRHPATEWKLLMDFVDFPNRLDLLRPPPIPWQVRFPFPYYLSKVPPWPTKKGVREIGP